MDVNLIDIDPTYIMEKWEKYIGVIPKSKDLSYYSIIFIPPSPIKPMIV
jgi:hypothetical protein